MSTVVVSDEVRIPDWVKDLKSFRRWAWSGEYPERGWVSYLNGEIWVDMSMEQLFTHNQVKTEYTVVLGSLVRTEALGYFFADRVLLSNRSADLATEPDGPFVSFESLESEKIRFIERATDGPMELTRTGVRTFRNTGSSTCARNRSASTSSAITAVATSRLEHKTAGSSRRCSAVGSGWR